MLRSGAASASVGSAGGLWRIFRAIALEYIALVFAVDFILAPLQGGGLGRYPLTYLPFALMLICGTGLRLAAFVWRKSVADKIDLGMHNPL